MPLLAALAVALCTTMVLVTWSVMGGFLDMLLDSGRNLIGDVAITWPNSGFAYYDELGQMLQDDEMVQAWAPMIETFGLISLPDGRRETVMVKGIQGPSYARVTNYKDTLYWQPLDKPLRTDPHSEDWRLTHHDLWENRYEQGLSLTEPRIDRMGQLVADEPAVVLGIELSGFNIRKAGGWYMPGVPRKFNADGTEEAVDVFMPNSRITLTVLPLDDKGRNIDVTARAFPVANEFRTGLYDLDKNVVLIRLDALQNMLKLHEAQRVIKVDADMPGTELQPESFDQPGEVLTKDPARVTAVIVRAVDGFDAITLKARCREIYAKFEARHQGDVPAQTAIIMSTWEDQNRTMISAVKKETALVLTLFSFISLTAVMLIVVIFWVMVAEKTRDIGVIRALGASKTGIASIWLIYGLCIGLVGSAMGGILSYTIVTNINPIHEWMGNALGITIWDPSVYYFSSIPNQMDAFHAAIVLVGGVLASVVGAALPSLRAANLDPVRALRFE